MPRKKYKAEDIVSKLRQVDVLVAQRQRSSFQRLLHGQLRGLRPLRRPRSI